MKANVLFLILILVISTLFSCSKKHEYLGKVREDKIVTYSQSIVAQDQLKVDFAKKFTKINDLYVDQNLKALLKDKNFEKTRISLRDKFNKMQDKLWDEYDKKSASISEKGKDFIEK